jgi:APA family basic amino acid/polyamine antiporter
VAIAFSQYLQRLTGHGGIDPRVIAVAAIAFLSAVNYVGVKPGSRLLNVFVVLKVAALAVLILCAWSGTGAADWATRGRADATTSGAIAFGAALIPILFTYGGWQQANYVAEEIRDPERWLPRSLIIGTIIVVVIYLLINVAYLRALGLDGLAATTTPSSDAAGRWFGRFGERFVAGAIAISTFGFLDLCVLAPTRVYYAMARDGAFLPAVAHLHPKYQTPSTAIIMQSTWAILLVLTGKYDDLLNTVVFADWIFFGLTVGGLFVLRKKLPATSGFKTPGYPVLPALFVIVAMVVVASTIKVAPWRSLAGMGLLLAGVPFYYFFTMRPRA